MGLFGVGPILGLAIIGGVLYFLFREDGLLRGPSPGPRPESARDIWIGATQAANSPKISTSR